MAIANVLVGIAGKRYTWAPNYTGPSLVVKTVPKSSSSESVQLRFGPDGSVTLPAGGSFNFGEIPGRWLDENAAAPWQTPGFDAAVDVIDRWGSGVGTAGPPTGVFYDLTGGSGFTLTLSLASYENNIGTYTASFGLRIYNRAHTQYVSPGVIDLQLRIT